ncbi:transmembrane protein [Cardiosporidium cionae]|uniref:Transmembrane protein n=1 Tax=Cardiosporidium cionae TaxID=476202 RepID=A0ABQ7JB78_9APIC|nr:transmembrane protein [Cardiosporidium cionae]|eukprot:KAF8821267.1 transmembrane protein [Cardiosporidium cionae]
MGLRSASLFVSCLLCWLSLYALTFTSGLYFHMHEGIEKCFEEIGALDAPITMFYDVKENPGLPLLVTIRDAHGYEIYKKEISPESSSGRVGYSPAIPDSFRICLTFPSSSWYHRAVIKVSVSFDINDGPVDLGTVVKKSHLTDLERQLQNALSRVETFYATTEFEQSQEESLERSFKKINKRIVWVITAQIGMALASSFFIVYHLTKFFRSQKIV